MSGAHAKLEHAEHAAHSGGHGHGHDSGNNNKLFGVTMALIGVLIAFCSLMVGSERNELTRAMIEQTQAHADYTAASTKYRLIMIELVKQKARVATAKDAPGSFSPVERFIQLAGDYAEERKLGRTWANSYKPVVDGHFDAAEGYELAQLIAEVGIVLASLAVLLASRPAWIFALFLSVICVAQLGRTYIHTTHEIERAMVKVHQAEDEFDKLRNAHGGGKEDEQIIQQLDADGSIRASIATRAKNRPPGEPQSASGKESGKD
jgi:hypothetical protein